MRPKTGRSENIGLWDRQNVRILPPKNRTRAIFSFIPARNSLGPKVMPEWKLTLVCIINRRSLTLLAPRQHSRSNALTNITFNRKNAPPSPCHPEEPTCLLQVKGAMNSTGRRALDGCPMFAPANVGRKSRAKPLERFWSVQGTVVHPERSRGTCSSLRDPHEAKGKIFNRPCGTLCFSIAASASPRGRYRTSRASRQQSLLHRSVRSV